MKIIRDEEAAGPGMIPLFVDWKISRCNVKGCAEKPTTIISGLPDDMPPIGMCETHYQESASTPGTVNYKIVYDGYDAFKAAEQS